jgi:GNAT superfamily N-acetyltransferase
MEIRPARPDDAEAIAAVVIEGDETFADFAPPGWHAPPYEAELEYARDAIASPHRWTAVAVSDGEVVGYATFVSGVLTKRRTHEPGLAHLGRLFVRKTYWGTGVATTLHNEAIAAAAARGFIAMRLFTPSAHARARRFYEREGWLAVDHLPDNDFGMPLSEYRRAL